MSGRRLTVLAASLVLAALLVPLSQARTESTATVKILSVLSGYTPHDVAPSGASPGDWIIERDRLYNLVPQFGQPKGAFVGTDSAVVKVDPSIQTATFHGVSHLAGGTITAGGRIPIQTNGVVTLKILGGTGRFAHARGTVVIRSSDARHATNTFRLTLR
jgi:hypothetical protein